MPITLPGLPEINLDTPLVKSYNGICLAKNATLTRLWIKNLLPLKTVTNKERFAIFFASSTLITKF